MKKLLSLISIITLCICTALFISCNVHAHTFAEEWSNDENGHWHNATCTHAEEKLDYGAHSFGEWEIVDTAVGVITKQRVCSVCQYSETKNEHVHTFSEEWSKNETNHWHASTCEHDANCTKTIGFGEHEFDEEGEEVDEGTKFTCKVCGYYEIRESRYRVTAEQYTSNFESVNNLKLNVTGDITALFLLDDALLYSEFSTSSKYYHFDGTNYFVIEKDQDSSIWMKNESSEYEHQNAIGDCTFYLSVLKNVFSDLSYDCSTKTYIADSIDSNYEDHFVIHFKSIVISFVDSKLTSISFSVSYDSDDAITNYAYSEIGSVSVALPTDIHEHTYSTKWSYSSTHHYHETDCGHSATEIDREKHTFDKGVCTVCGYNVLKISEDGTTVTGISILVSDTDFNITSVTFPQGVTTIGEDAFNSYNKLTEIDIPVGITTIEVDAFAYCVNLARVSLPQGLTTIGKGAFRNCTSLTEITIPDTVTIIPTFMVYDCVNLKTINLSEGITSIGTGVFINCTALTEIVIPSTITTMDTEAFSNSSIKRIYYKGDANTWDVISKANDYHDLRLDSDTVVYFYSETDPDETGNFWHYEDGMPIAW